MWERFTENAKRVVSGAWNEAVRRKDDHIKTEHILVGICSDPNCTGARALTGMGSCLEEIAAAVGGPTNLKSAGVSLQDAIFGQSVARTLGLAVAVAGRMHHDYLGTEHILLGILSDAASCTSRALLDYGITYSRARREVERVLNERSSPHDSM